MGLTYTTDHSCSFIRATVFLSSVRAVEEGGFVAHASDVIHCEGAVDSSKLRSHGGVARGVPKHPKHGGM